MTHRIAFCLELDHEVADAFIAEMTPEERETLYRKNATVIFVSSRPGHWGKIAPDVYWLNISRV